MGLFKNVLNQLMEQVNLVSLSPEEKNLDSILKQAAKDASVILIPTENKGVYDVNVTLANGKPISYYGKLRYSYGIDDDEPFVNVMFVSNAFDNKEIQDSIIKDLIEWRRNEYGNQYNTTYGNGSENEIFFVIMGDGCFGKIPAIPDKHDSFKYADILEASGEVEADKKFCEFFIKKISGYTSVMIKSLEYSLGRGHKWPTKDDIIARQKAQAAKEAAERLAQAERKRAYPRKMKKIIEEVAKQMKWEITPQQENNYFHMHLYDEGAIYIRYSKDVDNPTVNVEFLSIPFDSDWKADRMGTAISNSNYAKSLKVYVVDNIMIKLCQDVLLKDVDNEEQSIEQIKISGIQSVINAVVDIRENVMKWPTKSEWDARIREMEARRVAEERERRALEAAAREEAEARQRQEMIEECKLNIKRYEAEAAKYQAAYTSFKSVYDKEKRDKARAKKKEEEYKLQQLKAGVDLDEI